MRRRVILMGGIVVATTLAVLFVVLEIGARTFYPDRELFYQTDSAALWYYRPNQSAATRLGDGSLSPMMEINSLGLRGPEPDKSRPSILLLGDSFTFGGGVSDDETFAARLAQMFGNGMEIVNGGQPGYGIFQMQAAFERLAREVRPQMAVVVIWQGDFLRQPPSDDDRALYFRRKKQSELLKRSTLVTHLYRNFERVVARIGSDKAMLRVGDLAAAAQTSGRTLLDQHVAGLEADLPRLLEIHRGASASGQGAMIVLWTKEGFAALTPADSGIAEALTSRLAQFASENGIPFLSLQSTFAAVPLGSSTIPNDGHPNVFGHCLAAKALAAQLATSGFSPDTAAVTCSPTAQR